MGYTNMKTWSGSEVLTSADQNTYVGSNIQYNYDNKPEANQFLSGTTNVAQENQRIESGTAYKMFTTASAGSVAVTYNTAYGTAPRTVISSLQVGYVCSVVSNGTGGFNAWLETRTGGTVTGSKYFNWIAIGA